VEFSSRFNTTATVYLMRLRDTEPLTLSLSITICSKKFLVLLVGGYEAAAECESTYIEDKPVLHV